jgi:DNA-binding HxlR family transcriptional regulator
VAGGWEEGTFGCVTLTCVRAIVESVGKPADVYAARCPSRLVLDHIANKWSLLIIDALADGTLRYTHLLRRIQGVSQKMLTQTLRLLEADGFIKRTIHASVPPRVDYELTQLGHSLREPIAAIREWTEENINHIERARAAAGAPALHG